MTALNTPRLDQRTRLARRIAHAPELIRELDVTITKLDAQGATGGAQAERALVFNVHASECQDELRKALARLARLALAGRQAAIPIGRNTDLDAEAARIALAGLNTLLGLRDIDAEEARLAAAITRATRAIDRAEERITYGPCSCGVELSAPASRDLAKCSTCGRAWNLAELKAFRYVAARDRAATAIGTVAELVDIARGLGLKATRHSINARIRRHGIAPAGTRAGRNLYRFGDLDLDHAPTV